MSDSDNEDYESDDDSAYGDDGHRQADNDGYLAPGIRDLNLSPQYVSDWVGKHAYREVLQNQVDGIRESFGLRLDEIKVTKTKYEKQRRIEIRILNARTSELCGFQIFRYDKEQRGTLLICNLDAFLCDNNFDLGGTTKKHKSYQAGQHGEGFKVAALVFVRAPNNYGVRITASSSYVNFNFNKRRKLVARISDVGADKIRKHKEWLQKREISRLCQNLEVRPWRDVCWEIGIKRKRKTLNGSGMTTSKVSLKDFEQWLTVTTIIDPPQTMIRTEYGNLILDQSFKGKVFLRGLELPNSSASEKEFCYGYDLMSGSTGRDRTSLSDPHEESKLMANIWSQVIIRAAEGKEQQALLQRYLDLIAEDKNADVHNALKRVPRRIVIMIWECLRNKASVLEPPEFYYGPESVDDDIQLIEHCLQRRPVPLARNTWDLLMHHKLCRSPTKEREIRFRDLPAINVTELSSFGATLLKLLKACLLAELHTEDKQLVIVDGGALDVRSYYDSDSETWKLEKKLFDVRTAHEGVYCCEALASYNGEQEADGIVFCCTHAVVDLYSSMLEDLKQGDLEEDTTTAANAKRKHLVSKAFTRSSRVAQQVMISSTERGGELRVSWESLETQYTRKHSALSYAVTLHQNVAGACKDKTQYLLHKPGMKNLCDCEAVKVPLHRDDYIFSNIAPSNAYFVTLRHDDEVAIYATSINKCEVEAQVVLKPLPQTVHENDDAYVADAEMAEIRDDSRELEGDVMLAQSVERSAELDAGHPASGPKAGTDDVAPARRRADLATPSSPYADFGINTDSDIDNAADAPPQYPDKSRRRTARYQAYVTSVLTSPERGMRAADEPSAVPDNGLPSPSDALTPQDSGSSAPAENEARVRTSAKAPDRLDVPLLVEKVNAPEIMRRNWYEGRPGGPHEGTWVGIPKDVDDAYNTEVRGLHDRPKKRRRYADI